MSGDEQEQNEVQIEMSYNDNDLSIEESKESEAQQKKSLKKDATLVEVARSKSSIKESLEEDDGGKWKDTEYFLSDHQNDKVKQDFDVYFETSIFWEFYFYHLVYFFFLGPLIFFFSLYQTKYKFLFSNMRLTDLSKTSLDQFLLFATVQFTFWNLVFGQDLGLYYYEMFSFYFILAMWAAIVSFKYATFTDDQMEEFETKYLSLEQTVKYQLRHWVLQDDESVVSEIVRSLRDFNTDNSIFDILFFYPLDKETRKGLDDSKLKVEKGLRDINTSEEETTKILKNSEPDQVDQNKASGYQIFYQLLQVHIKNISNPKLLLSYAVFISLGRVLIRQIFIVNIIEIQSVSCRLTDDDMMFSNKPYQIVVLVLLNMQLFQIQVRTLSMLLIGIIDIRRKIFLLNQASKNKNLYILKAYLICIQRNQNPYHNVPKIFPTLDILNAQSIQAWTYLKNLILQYGKPFEVRYSAIVTMFTIVTIFQLLFFFLNAFYAPTVNVFITVTNFYDLIVFLNILLSVLFMVSEINDHYDIHTQTLTENREKIDRINNLKDVYFKDGFLSTNLVDQEIITRLRKDDAEISAIGEALDAISTNIQFAIDSIATQRVETSIKIMGTEITRIGLIKNLISLVFIIPVAVLQTIKIKGLKANDD